MHRPSDRSQQPVLLLGFFLLLHVLNQVDRNLIASFGPEIVRDLEQAIADKCGTYLSGGKTVVTGAEMTKILAEMGPDVSDVDGTVELVTTPDGIYFRAPFLAEVAGQLPAGVAPTPVGPRWRAWTAMWSCRSKAR